MRSVMPRGVENVIVEVPYRVDEDAAETRGWIDAVEAALRVFDLD